MHSDEQEIRQLVSTWMTASKAGDVETVLSLIADDAVFLLPGQAVMRKADFAVAARAQSGQNAPQFNGSSEIQEIKIAMPAINVTMPRIRVLPRMRRPI